MKIPKTSNWLRGTASLLLFFAYFLNVVSFESFHHAVHHHEHAELHTEAAEEDACHRAIYHGEISRDCEHKSHLMQTVKDCELCKVTVSRFHFVANIAEALAEPVQTAFIQPASTGFFGNDSSLAVAPRGPPALS